MAHHQGVETGGDRPVERDQVALLQGVELVDGRRRIVWVGLSPPIPGQCFATGMRPAAFTAPMTAMP